MSELELLSLISDKLDTLINIILLFEFLKIGKGILSMWKGGLKD